MTMKPLLLLLLLLTLCSASLQDAQTWHRHVSLLKPNVKDRVPAASTSTLIDQRPSPRQKRHTEPSSSTFDTNSKLKWQRWSGTVPKEAVSINNAYDGRKDYICKYKCHAGFHNPDLGSYCHYPLRGEVLKDHLFEILVNEDNFEMLEWKEGHSGSVPRHSVRTCSNDKMYVGKNEYGLGRVDSSEGFYLPWKTSEYKYSSYQVLTIRRDVKEEHLSNIKYNNNRASITQNPPESMHISTIVNHECNSVSKTIHFKKTYQMERRWDIDSSDLFREKRSVSAVVPVMKVTTAEDPTTIPKNLTVEVSLGSSVQHFHAVDDTEAFSRSGSISFTIPPKHLCRVYVMGYKHKVNLPFTAHLTRTYSNGETTWMNATGTYEYIWTREVQVVLHRCKPANNTELFLKNPNLNEPCNIP